MTTTLYLLTIMLALCLPWLSAMARKRRRQEIAGILVSLAESRRRLAQMQEEQKVHLAILEDQP